ncbi:DUF2336 domain-containing protein [Arenibaculum pallidiluteum]|uniref:DUF2336 domain-containing protein n=1 Tax=Arenibaculum pallidiluteum TaxID=2812559 RepID=UPI001A978AAF|nr:DUF2336 domain-containing protein [Arenibaculum pallidiluteum]
MERRPITYEESRRLAQDQDPSVRSELAARDDVRPEVLYYLAVDKAVEVRRAVAGNAAAPIQASQLLARDSDESVRRILAAKLGRLLPELEPEKFGKLFQLTVEVLETLARDQALGVREALATSLADVACAPPRLCVTLAMDVAREVADPILHYCATLTDEDLLRLIAWSAEGWRVAAIARRASVSESVCEAIQRRGYAEATSALLRNAGARISEPVLDRIAEEAAVKLALQEPLAARPSLPPRLAARLAEFVGQQVLEVLRQRSDLDIGTVAEVSAVSRRRLAYRAASDVKEPGEKRAHRLHAAGRLDEEAIGDALAWQDMDFVKTALSLRAGVTRDTVEKILATQSPKGVTALAWKAQLSMRFAMQLQSRGAGIAPRQLLNARGGTDYPMTTVEMAWQLELYGVTA